MAAPFRPDVLDNQTAMRAGTGNATAADLMCSQQPDRRRDWPWGPTKGVRAHICRESHMTRRLPARMAGERQRPAAAVAHARIVLLRPFRDRL